jgi:cohesin complex subunit SA-1/2
MSLKITSALCEVAADVSKDLSMKQRQREAEAKKAGKTPAGLKRIKEAEKKVKEAHEMKVTLEGLMQETVDV